jgi:hypothetical protein
MIGFTILGVLGQLGCYRCNPNSREAHSLDVVELYESVSALVTELTNVCITYFILNSLPGSAAVSLFDKISKPFILIQLPEVIPSYSHHNSP